MKRSTRQQLLMSLTACLLSSCVIYTPTVPDMPYQGTAGRTTYPDTWMTTQPTGIEQAPIPEPVASQPITASAANAPVLSVADLEAGIYVARAASLSGKTATAKVAVK